MRTAYPLKLQTVLSNGIDNLLPRIDHVNVMALKRQKPAIGRAHSTCTDHKDFHPISHAAGRMRFARAGRGSLCSLPSFMIIVKRDGPTRTD